MVLRNTALDRCLINSNLYCRWLTPLESLIQRINEQYSDFFKRMGCAGQVALFKDPVDAYLKFKFRNMLYFISYFMYYYTILYCIRLCYIILYCIVLCYAVLQCFIVFAGNSITLALRERTKILELSRVC